MFIRFFTVTLNIKICKSAQNCLLGCNIFPESLAKISATESTQMSNNTRIGAKLHVESNGSMSNNMKSQ